MVKINEFFDNQSEIPDQILPPINFDVVEDLLAYMRNDPIFYRKSFFPVIDDCKTKGIVDTSMIEKVIKKGLHSYCKKYNILHDKNELMSNEDVKSLAQKIIIDDVKEKGESYGDQ